MDTVDSAGGPREHAAQGVPGSQDQRPPTPAQVPAFLFTARLALSPQPLGPLREAGPPVAWGWGGLDLMAQSQNRETSCSSCG